LGGGAIEVLASGEEGASSITLAGGWVYWSDWTGGSVRRARPGRPAETLATGLFSSKDVRVDGRYVYWAVPFYGEIEQDPLRGRLMRFDLHTSRLDTLVENEQVFGFDLDDNFLYWTGGDYSDVVARQRKRGGKVTQLATPDPEQLGDTFIVLADDGDVFWSNHGIHRKSPGHSGEKLVDSEANIHALVADDRFLYWPEVTLSDDKFTGRILRMSRDCRPNG
jgi:hypothetical protein